MEHNKPCPEDREVLTRMYVPILMVVPYNACIHRRHSA
jgi:hypothetical protein